MPRRDARAFLQDIIAACDAVDGFIAERGGLDLGNDAFLRAAIERELMIIGEAVWQLDRSFPELATRVTDAERIVGLRHILVHGYHSVNSAVLEGIVTIHLPVLRAEIGRIMEGLGSEPG